jgi:hypothetical protein
MSINDRETSIIAEVSSLECDSEVEREYRDHVELLLRGQKIETTLGTVSITKALASHVVGDRVKFHLEVLLEFPREEKGWFFNFITGDTKTFLARSRKEAQKWAVGRAEAILRAEDRKSGVLEIRRASKVRRDSHDDGYFYFMDCSCETCVAQTKLLETEFDPWDGAVGGNR